MLSTSDIAAMRTALTASMPDSVAISRATSVSDGYGGLTETWATVATVAGRVSPTGYAPDERAVAQRLGNVSSWVVTMPALTDVRVTDRLAVGSRTFEVKEVLGPRSYEVSRRVVCVEVV